MKKMTALLLAMLMIAASLSACKREVEPEPVVSSQPEPEPVYIYQDGEYAAQYTLAGADGLVERLRISVEKDVFSILEYELEQAAQETSGESASSSSAASQPQDASSGVQEPVLPANEQILKAYEDAGKDVEKMQPVEELEEHSLRFIRMMRTVVALAEKGDKATVTLGKYADGNYEVTMPDANSDGWIEFVKLTVSGGEITDMVYDAKKDGDPAALITADEALNKETNKPSVYYPQIVKNFIEAGGDLTKVLAPTGGAQATKTFGKLMRPLLETMVSGGKQNITATRLVDGEYRAQFKDFDEHGWKEYVVLSVDRGVVSIKEFDAINKNDETKLKSQDEESNDPAKRETGFAKAARALMAGWSKASGVPSKVDNVAGATLSSNNFKLLTGVILATTAIEGDTKTVLEVEHLETTELK